MAVKFTYIYILYIYVTKKTHFSLSIGLKRFAELRYSSGLVMNTVYLYKTEYKLGFYVSGDSFHSVLRFF